MLSYSHHKRIAQESHVNFNGTQPIKRQKSGFCSTQQTDLQVRTSLLCTRCSSSLRQVKASKAKSTGKAKWGERQAKVHDSQTQPSLRECRFIVLGNYLILSHLPLRKGLATSWRCKIEVSRVISVSFYEKSELQTGKYDNLRTKQSFPRN